MTFQQVCVAISGILAIIAYIPYIVGIVKKTIMPEKATWLVWLTIDVTALISMYVEGTVGMQMPAVVLGSVVTNALTLYYGKPGWTRLDITCMTLAVIGIAVWILSGNPHFGLLSFAVCNWIGFIPTLRSAWLKPDSQKNMAWQTNFIASMFSLIGLDAWTIGSATAPLTFFVMNAVILGILYRPNAPRG